MEVKRILLDTNAYVKFLHAMAVLDAWPELNRYISVFVVGELLAGFKAIERAHNRKLLSSFCKSRRLRYIRTMDTAEFFAT